jgi:small subunit ribosomal protein S9
LMVLWGDYMKMFDATIVVRWWWSRGQSDAIKLSFARALTEFNDELKPMLKPFALLKRDPRIKERKKPGLKKARKAPRRSKR